MVLAIPVAWLVSYNWLTDFAYRISLHWSLFLVAGSIIVILALCTVGVRAAKVGSKNPISGLAAN